MAVEGCALRQDGSSWVLVRTCANHERRVVANLGRRGIVALCPTRKVRTGKRVRETALLRNLILADRPADERRRLELLSTPSVVEVLPGEPLDQEVRLLLELGSNGGVRDVVSLSQQELAAARTLVPLGVLRLHELEIGGRRHLVLCNPTGRWHLLLQVGALGESRVLAREMPS